MKLEKFKDLLRQSDDIEQRDQKGRTALFRAARIGKADIVRLLLDHGADPNAEDSTGEAPLQAASRYGYVECVEMLIAAGARLDHCPPPQTSGYSETALCSTVRKHPEIAKILLSHGANPNSASPARRLPLIFAASDEDKLDILITLLDAGARINEQDTQGRSALHAAIDAGSIPLIKMLLQQGADLEVESLQGGTALCAAILNYEANRASLVQALLPARPSLVAICPSWNMTPIELATEFELPEVIKLLLDAGSPQPRPQDPAEAVISSIEMPEGLPNTGIHLVSIDYEPSPEDRALAREICGKPTTLYQRFGWRSSPHHWHILEGLTSRKNPIPLSRIAYYVRGHLNAPAGRELLDGPQLLGQSYHEAVAVMVAEGLVVQATDEEALILSATTTDLSKIAKNNGIQLSGAKKVLVERLIAHLGIEQLKQQVNLPAHFRISSEGCRMLQERDKQLSETEDMLKNELLDLLYDKELVPACEIGVQLWTILGRRMSAHGVVHEDQFASCIANARWALEAPMPPQIELTNEIENSLRTVIAAVSLIGDQKNDWSYWQPPVDDMSDTEEEEEELMKPSAWRMILRNEQEE
jgi:ankyrin repeat protein